MPNRIFQRLYTRVRASAAAHPRLTATLLLGALGAASLAAGLLVGAWNNVCHQCPSIAQIYAWEPKLSTKLLSHDGQLIAELFRERRTPVPLEDLPPHLIGAFLAIEDRRFYQHEGFDYRRIVTANVRNVLAGEITGGGSTITQQLARNMFREEVGFEQRITRKLKEARVAVELEQVYAKDEILEAYLNQINFGHGWYGIETAAQRYFGKSAREVDPAESAMLAALPKAPSRYSPLRNPEFAAGRRNLVLSVMADQNVISAAEADRWKREPLPTEAHGLDEGEFAPYFVEWVRDLLDDRFGTDVYEQGLRVYTTLDIDMQRLANQAMSNGWRRIEEQPGFRWPTYAEVIADENRSPGTSTPYLQGLFVALEPATGEVRALIGGRDFEDSKFNRVTQARRQPGSAFKPFVFTAAIASGIPASHVINDAPVMLEMEDGTIYSPRNYDREFFGPLTLREALRRSINTVAVKLGLEVGLETVAQYAQRMGLSTPVPRYPSMSIGAPDVIPLEIAGAYTTFASLGVHAEPRPILRVLDQQDRVLWETRPERRTVVDSAVGYIMADLLRDVVDHGTGYTVRAPDQGNLPYEVPAAGKTGTTNDATDIWFIGFTPDLLAAVWFGFDQPKQIVPGAAGGLYGAPVWGEFMRHVYTGPDSLRPVPQPWQAPQQLVTRSIDRETGQLASEWCSPDNIVNEIFIPGTEPTERCALHDDMLGAPLRGTFPDRLPNDTSGVN
ncbi:MAG: penicillin-binding protein 1A [Longimicrobiales bacterium]